MGEGVVGEVCVGWWECVVIVVPAVHWKLSEDGQWTYKVLIQFNRRKFKFIEGLCTLYLHLIFILLFWFTT